MRQGESVCAQGLLGSTRNRSKCMIFFVLLYTVQKFNFFSSAFIICLRVLILNKNTIVGSTLLKLRDFCHHYFISFEIRVDPESHFWEPFVN